jgi:hypothetical protein
MIRESGLAPICEGCDVPDVSYAYESWDEELKAFAELVRAAEREEGQRWFDAVTAQHKQELLAEREACAKIAWNMEPDENGPIETAIRARGNK